MKIFSQDLLLTIMSAKPAGYLVRFTLTPENADGTPQEDVTVTLTAAGYTQVGNYIDVPVGTNVAWSASGATYNTQSGNITVVGDTEKKVTLSALPMRTYTIVPVPADSTVTMTSGSFSSNTGTISVPEGSTVSWAVGHAGMNGKSGNRLVPQNSSEGSTITEYKTLTATIALSSVSPNNANVDWRIGTGNPTHDVSITTDVDKAVSLVISKDGYQSYTRNFPENGDQYLINTTIAPVTLTPISLTCTMSTTTTGATVTMKVNGVQKAQSTNSATVNCIVGDVISWTVSMTGYTSQSGTYTMGTSSASLPPVTLVATTRTVTITASVTNATVRIMSGGNIIASGLGSASANVNYGTYITYTATLADVTASGSATITGAYTDSLVVDAKGTSVTVRTTSGTVVLPYGVYRVIAVGGGAGGKASSGNPTWNSSTPRGANGGGGGGSGGVKVFTLTVNNTSGSSCAFTIGTGGSANTDGGTTSVQLTGSSAISASGGSTTQTSNSGYQYGGDSFEGSGGGSGGGGGGTYSYVTGGTIGGIGRSGSINQLNGGGTVHYVTVASQDGGRGGVNGYNGEARTYGGGSTGTRAVPGGTGLYQQELSYANNAGAKGTDGTLNVNQCKGHAGGGGTGVIAAQSTLTNVSNFSTFSESQLLAVAIGSLSGGGGGGSTGTPPTSSSSSGTLTTCWGGAGGGGGGWQNGTAGSDNTPGVGGNGAVLYMRIGWPS